MNYDMNAGEWLQKRRFVNNKKSLNDIVRYCGYNKNEWLQDPKTGAGDLILCYLWNRLPIRGLVTPIPGGN